MKKILLALLLALLLASSGISQPTSEGPMGEGPPHEGPYVEGPVSPPSGPVAPQAFVDADGKYFKDADNKYLIGATP